MPSVYSQISKNRTKTILLILVFIGLIVLIGRIIDYFFGSDFAFWFALAFATFMPLISYWYSDKIVLGITRAKPIDKSDNPELYRILENLCIATGLPMPKLYILEELQPNAFATGRDPKHSAIAVTRGLLEILDRKELEGVLAHELSHIKNRDTLVSTIAAVLAGVIITLVDFFLRFGLIFGFRGEDRREGNIFGSIILLAVLILAPLGATLLRLAVSRQREYLADASAALITRYPQGLINALIKISSNPHPLKVANHNVNHLFFANPLKENKTFSFIESLFSTHPPVEKRIEALKSLNI
ncbi:Protease HtpX [bacterium HR34]|nr:Protease HtpX [bacterium HR34]